MWTDMAVGRLPQRMISRQGLRISDIERRAAQHARRQRRDQRILVEDLSAGNIRDERPRPLRRHSTGQNAELLLAQQMRRLRRQRQRHDEMVESQAQERADGLPVRPVVPRCRDRAVGVARPGHDVPRVASGVGRRPRRCGEGVHAHAEGRGGAPDLSPDAAVAEDADGFADLVVHAVHVGGDAAPVVLLLVLVGGDEFAGGDEPVHEGPFGDWGAVDAGAGGGAVAGVLKGGVVDEVVDAGGEEVEQFDALFDVSTGVGWFGWRGRGDGAVEAYLWASSGRGRFVKVTRMVACWMASGFSVSCCL